MTELLVKNAFVIDPLSGVKGEIMDLAVRDGKIVEEVGSGAVVIDAEGCLTLPGGIDSHSHVCGTKVNFGRYMSPEDMRAGRTTRKGVRHVTSGYSVPTTLLKNCRPGDSCIHVIAPGRRWPELCRPPTLPTRNRFTLAPADR